VFTNLGGFFLKFVRFGISETLAYVVYALLFLPFLYALLNLWKLYRMAPADLAFIGGFGKALLVINYVAWLLYPLGYVLGPFFAGAVSDNAEQLFYVVGDLLVKVLVPIYVVYALWTACGDCAPEPRRDCYEEPDPCEMHAYSDDYAPAHKGVPKRQGFTLSDWAKRVAYR
jgi:bacteriorhodopsin